MSILVKTLNPSGLLTSIREGIEQNTVTQWSIDKDGDFSFLGTYVGRAWLRPRLQEGEIRFSVLTSKGTVMKRSTYTLYHSRWIEMLLEHFDGKFISATASALPTAGDLIKSATAPE